VNIVDVFGLGRKASWQSVPAIRGEQNAAISSILVGFRRHGALPFPGAGGEVALFRSFRTPPKAAELLLCSEMTLTHQKATEKALFDDQDDRGGIEAKSETSRIAA
jgi:hypothetical protein